MQKNKKSGFTLIEILIVVGIIAILSGVVIIAINPAKQFAQARNTQRQAGVNAILNAVGQRIADNKGVFQGSFTIASSTYTCGPIPLATTSITNINGSNPGELGCLVPTYISNLPVDPNGAAEPQTGYDIRTDNVGRVTVCAPQSLTETSIPGASLICVTR